MQGAHQVGINVNQVFALTFALSVVLTGIAGNFAGAGLPCVSVGGVGPFP